MINSFLPVLLLLILAVAFPLGLVFVTGRLGPKVGGRTKLEPYECGVPPIGTVRERIPVKFYRIAILFLIFDVEAAFLFPWAALFRSKLPEWGAPFMIGELGLFLLILVVAYIYAWKRGALEWD